VQHTLKALAFIEHMFEHDAMNALTTAAAPSPASPMDLVSPVRPADELARLRDRIARVEGRSAGRDAPALPAPAGLAGRLPGLRAGCAYATDASMPLLTRLVAEPTRAGIWCAIVGMPEFGVEAARDAGADLSRLVLIPHPGDRWVGIAAAAIEVMGLVALRPGGRVTDGQAARLAARLRERGTVLLAERPPGGPGWPQAEAALRVRGHAWSGLAEGHGRIEREVPEFAVEPRWGMRRERPAGWATTRTG